MRKLLILIILITTGCSGTHHAVDLMYEPEEVSHCMQHAVPVRTRLSVAINRSSTGDPKVIGQARTGVFNTAVPTTSEIPLQNFFWDSLAQGFLKAGIRAVGPEEPSDYNFKLKITQFWVHEFIPLPPGILESAEANVSALMTLRDKDNNFVLWQNSQQVHIKDPGLLDATSSLDDVANQASTELLHRILNDRGFCIAIRNNLFKQRRAPQQSYRDTPPQVTPPVRENDELILD